MSDLGDNFDDSGPEDWEPEEPDWGALEPTDDDLREMEYARLEAIWGPEADRVESASYSFERARSLSERDSLVRIEALTTRAGWLDFAVHLEDAVEGLGVALADLPPPKVEWAVALGSAGDQLERDVDWEVHFNGLELTVALLEPGDDPMLWRRLHEHRGTLVQRTQEWTTRDADAYDDYIVKWQVLAQANDRHIHLDSSEQVHAALVVALAEASSRVWISVPWWRADNRYGAAVVDLAARSASRGIDVRVMVRPPDRGNFGPDHSKQIVQRLRKAGAKVALNPAEHTKTFIVDEMSILSSSNLTQSDTLLDNNGDLALGFQGTNARAKAFLRKWEIFLHASKLLRK